MSYTQNNPLSRKNSPLNSFDSLVTKLEGQGKSHEAATKIAGSVANAKMHGAGSGPTAKQKARHGVSRQPGKPVEENRMTKGDQMPSRKSSSPLNNTGMTGLNYSKELRYNTVDDITQGKGEADYGFSRESSSPLDYGSWAHEDATRAKDLYAKGDDAHARALGVDEHDADYGKWKSSEAEHGTSRRSSSPLNNEGHGGEPGHGHANMTKHLAKKKPISTRSERLRKRAIKRSERSGAEWGDYDYEDKRVQKMLSKASELDERSGGEMKMMMTKNIKPLPKKKA